MAVFVLVPGGGCDPSCWRLLIPELVARGHDAVAVNLPCEDGSAGLPEYVDAVVAAAAGRDDLVVVGHSYGAFTAALLPGVLPVRLLVYLSGMVPKPGERPNDWWVQTGHDGAHRRAAAALGFDPDDVIELFYNDVPAEIVADEIERGQSDAPGRDPWPGRVPAEAPTRFLLLRDDRLFPPEFMRRVVEQRLGIRPDEMDGGHMVMLSRPAELADRLVGML